jgi:hypothetical protein
MGGLPQVYYNDVKKEIFLSAGDWHHKDAVRSWHQDLKNEFPGWEVDGESESGPRGVEKDSNWRKASLRKASDDFGDAFWVDPKGVPNQVDFMHLLAVLQNPQSYGLTPDESEQLRSLPRGDRQNQLLEKLMFTRGWVRLRFVGHYLIVHGKLTKTAIKNVQNFLRKNPNQPVYDVFTKSWPSGKEKEENIDLFMAE